ncbi:hypothetical protein [Chromohalobacter canadensis]|uniref:hypothetical protein n=1 Tax=Chromohalobacter canadensis TaxID=141389 RepID=UPI00240FABC3|nr:hypothetical protein [Chromohalobacter canadensis]
MTRKKKPTLAERALQAKEEGLKHFETPDKPCRKCGGIVRQTNRQANCIECDRKRSLRFRQKNPGHRQAYYQSRRDHYLKVQKAYRGNNRERYRKLLRDWHEVNPGYRVFMVNKHRFKRIGWDHDLFDDQIFELYQHCGIMNQFLGVEGRGIFEVDHIIPVNGVDENREPVVSGLHLPDNLDIVTNEENREKWNYFTPFVVVYDESGRVIDTYVIEDRELQAA